MNRVPTPGEFRVTASPWGTGSGITRVQTETEYAPAVTYEGPRMCSVVRIERPPDSLIGATEVETIMERLTRGDAEEIAAALQRAYQKGWRDASD